MSKLSGIRDFSKKLAVSTAGRTGAPPLASHESCYDGKVITWDPVNMHRIS